MGYSNGDSPEPTYEVQHMVLNQGVPAPASLATDDDGGALHAPPMGTRTKCADLSAFRRRCMQAVCSGTTGHAEVVQV